MHLRAEEAVTNRGKLVTRSFSFEQHSLRKQEKCGNNMANRTRCVLSIKLS